MDHSLLLAAALLLLGLYAVEQLCRAIAVPSVIAFITAGLLARPGLAMLSIHLDWVGAVVPMLGTVGLVLIVLEGALDVELRRDRLGLIVATLAASVVGFLLCLLPLAWLGGWLLDLNPVAAFLLATPFAVISSAVAIPASSLLAREHREFVVYESSLSDILGVLVFFALLGADGRVAAALDNLFEGGLISLPLSLLAALALIWALSRVSGPIRFVPLLAMLFALYAAGKMLHLSPLLMVLVLGLLLNNPHLLQRLPLFRAGMGPAYLETLGQFRSLVVELTFVVRGFFFVLLGLWTDPSALAQPAAWAVALIALLVVYATRYPLLRLLRGRDAAAVLVWMAPRGLITVLLFIAARDTLRLPDYLLGAVLLLVLASALLMSRARGAAGR